MNGRTWKAEEIDQLRKEWGRTSFQGIAKKHNRSVNAIKLKAQRLGLGNFLLANENVSLSQVLKAFKMTSGYDWQVKKLEKAGLKIHMQRIEKQRIRMINLTEFWKFAEAHKSFFDFSKLEKNALGEEPKWVAAVRREDFNHRQNIKPNNTPWSKAEEKELLRLVKMQRYSYLDISARLHRTYGAVARKLVDLGVKDRPVKAENHIKWTDEETDILCEMIKQGSTYENISRVLNKSAKAIQGKVYSMYLTERLDNVRKIIGNGKWGDNRPERNLKQYNVMTVEEKKQTKANLNRLVCLLAYRAQNLNDLDNCYGWQHYQCRHWDNSKGCLVGETDCDSCNKYRRKDCEDL